MLPRDTWPGVRSCSTAVDRDSANIAGPICSPHPLKRNRSRSPTSDRSHNPEHQSRNDRKSQLGKESSPARQKGRVSTGSSIVASPDIAARSQPICSTWLDGVPKYLSLCPDPRSSRHSGETRDPQQVSLRQLSTEGSCRHPPWRFSTRLP